MNHNNFFVGPKTGDLINCLQICKAYYENTKNKCNLWIDETKDKFELELDRTFQELLLVLEEQEYIGSVNKGKPQSYFDLNQYRTSKLLYKKCWRKIFQSYSPWSLSQEYSWINWPYKDNKFEHTLVYYVYDKLDFPLEDSFELFDEIFKLKPEKHSLWKLFTIINSCGLLISNQSLPLAIASALDQNRLGILERKRDYIHYQKETQYSSKLMYWHSSKDNKSILGQLK